LGITFSPATYLIRDSDSKRLSAFIKRKTGKSFAKLVQSDKGFTLAGLTKKQHEKAVETCRTKKETFYNHGDRWLISGHHFAWRNGLEQQVNQALVAGGHEIRETTPKTLEPNALERSFALEVIAQLEIRDLKELEVLPAAMNSPPTTETANCLIWSAVN